MKEELKQNLLFVLFILGIMLFCIGAYWGMKSLGFWVPWWQSQNTDDPELYKILSDPDPIMPRESSHVFVMPLPQTRPEENPLDESDLIYPEGVFPGGSFRIPLKNEGESFEDDSSKK